MVLDLSRPSSRGGALPGWARLSFGGRSAHSQPCRRTRHEHGNWRCGEPCLEARSGATRRQAALLETYESERIGFAKRLVATTDQAFTEVTSSRPTARLIRGQLAPRVAPLFLLFASARRFFFRTVSQTAIHYRGSALSKGIAGAVRGGDRLPWIKFGSNGHGEDNFAPLTSLELAGPHLRRCGAGDARRCARRGLPLHVFPYDDAMRHAGLRRNAAYLLRPDGYVAMAEPDGKAAAVESYLDTRGIVPRRQGAAVCTDHN